MKCNPNYVNICNYNYVHAPIHALLRHMPSIPNVSLFLNMPLTRNKAIIIIYDIIIITRNPGKDQKMSISGKNRQLHENRTFNFTSGKVKSELFSKSVFFDKHDLMQVKYEMLRAVQKDGESITKSCHEFGLSRTAFYRAKKEFERDGLCGLIPEKKGPHGPNKLKGDILSLLEELRSGHPDKSVKELHSLLQEKFNVKIHQRTVKRALQKVEQKKGLRR